MTVELVVLAPLAITFILFLVILGRVAEGNSAAEAAARDGARAGSISRAPDADQAARAAVAADLADAKELSCGAPQVSTVAGGSQFRVRLQCSVDVTGLSLLPGLGTPKVTGTSVSPIDSYRGTN